MKKKNFLRNFSATALAMCCLSSAIAFTSFASFEENNEENLGNIAWLFEEEEKSASSSKGLKLTLTQPFRTKASFPVINDEGNFDYKGDNHCTLTFEADNAFGSSINVTGSTENNNGVVFIPSSLEVFEGNEMKVTKINPDAKFPNTKTLVVLGESEFDDDKIKENNPEISLLLLYGNNKA